MATTLIQAFQTLKTNLEITGLQQSTVSTRQQSVRKAVADSMGVVDSFLTGSYSRHTMIAPLKEADIDIFIVLESRYFNHYNGQNGGQGGLLDLVKRTLRKTYTKTPEISRNGQAVSIQFTDFLVDVVPGFNRQGGGYLIPNSIDGSWLSTDPKKHVEIMANANAAHNGDLVPLVKMIKAWNKVHGRFFRSFHLEVLALQVLQGITISDYHSGVRFYFDKARALISQKNPDPAGYGDDVGAYLNTQQKIQEATTRLQTAYETALRAESSILFSSSVDTWRKLFGGYFPAYG